MSSNSDTVTKLCEHVNMLKNAVLEPIQEYSDADGVSTLPPELERAVQALTSYALCL